MVVGLDRTRGEGIRAVDLLDEAGVRRVVGEILAEGPLDGVALLAGGYAQASVVETDLKGLEAMLSINLKTAVTVLRAVAPAMIERGYGRLVAMGAFAAARPSARQAAYNASKAALVTFVQTVAEEVRDKGDLSFVTLLPTTLDTEANRRAMPRADATEWVRLDRIARVITFLMSDAAGDLNGAVIPVRARL